MARILVAAPTEEPLTIDEAKLHLRIHPDEDAEDAYVVGLIKAARWYVEQDTWRAIMTQTWKLVLDEFPSDYHVDAPIVVPLPPLQSVTHIKYIDTAGVLQTLPTTDYIVDTVSEPGRIVPAYGLSWPVTRETINAVEVQYVCGFTDAAKVPPGLQAAIKLFIGMWYEHREPVVIGQTPAVVPFAADALLASYRVLWMA